jgi:hypothetical protein
MNVAELIQSLGRFDGEDNVVLVDEFDVQWTVGSVTSDGVDKCLVMEGKKVPND